MSTASGADAAGASMARTVGVAGVVVVGDSAGIGGWVAMSGIVVSVACVWPSAGLVVLGRSFKGSHSDFLEMAKSKNHHRNACNYYAFF